MRRPAALLAATVTLFALLAAVAYAAVIQCTGNPCVGTDEPDQITGTLQRDRIFARDGADDVIARQGNDYVKAGAGDDGVSVGGGNDEALGVGGDDDLGGGAGDDVLRGGDSSSGGPTAAGPTPPAETLSDKAGPDADDVFGGPGGEDIDVQDGDDDDFAHCGPADGGAGSVAADPGDTVDISCL
jgi:hypothetical protein